MDSEIQEPKANVPMSNFSELITFYYQKKKEGNDFFEKKEY